MSRVLIALLAVLAVGCGSSQRSLTAPSAVTGPLRLGLAGQSNSMLIRPFLAERVEVPAFYGEVTTIAPCWASGGSCWAILQPTLRQPLDAVVWSQGESDVLADTPLEVYAQRQTELVARIRAANGNPRLLIVVLQMGPFFDNGRGGDLGKAYQRFKREWPASDPNAIYIETQDCGFQADQVHMTEQGYRDVSARIAERVSARLGR